LGDIRPKFILNETTGRYVHTAVYPISTDKSYNKEYNPATNSIATYTGIVPEVSKATMVDYYSEIGIAKMFEKKDPGFEAALKKHMDTNPTQAPTIELLCGNGIVDEGEVCDIDKTTGFRKTIHGTNEWISFNGKTNLVQWAVLGIPTSIIYGEKNIKTFCTEVAGSDCTDYVNYDEANGYCSSDCQEFKPLIVCQDDDWMPLADTGMGTYLGPKFYLQNGNRKMADTFDYLYSDMDKKNPCAPAGVTPLGKEMLEWK
jgi:hypothetical protein